MYRAISPAIRAADSKSVGVLFRLFRACRDGLAHYQGYRSDIAHLRALNDSMLRDIGIERSQIEPTVRGLSGWSKP